MLLNQNQHRHLMPRLDPPIVLYRPYLTANQRTGPTTRFFCVSSPAGCSDNYSASCGHLSAIGHLSADTCPGRPANLLAARQAPCQTSLMQRKTILPPPAPSRGGIGEYLGQLPPTGASPLGSAANDLGNPTVPAGTCDTLLPSPRGSEGFTGAPKPIFPTSGEPQTKNLGPVIRSGASDRSSDRDFSTCAADRTEFSEPVTRSKSADQITEQDFGPLADQTGQSAKTERPAKPTSQSGQRAGQTGWPEGEGEGRIVFQKVKGAGPGGENFPLVVGDMCGYGTGNDTAPRVLQEQQLFDYVRADPYEPDPFAGGF